MFPHPDIASHIAREHQRDMLTAAARLRLRHQAGRQASGGAATSIRAAAARLGAALAAAGLAATTSPHRPAARPRRA